MQHQILLASPLSFKYVSILGPFSSASSISPSLRYFYLPNLMFTQCKLNVIWPKGSNPPWGGSPNWISTSPRPTTPCSFYVETHHFTIYYLPSFILCTWDLWRDMDLLSLFWSVSIKIGFSPEQEKITPFSKPKQTGYCKNFSQFVSSFQN